MNKRMRVMDLVKELGLETKVVLAKLRDLGINVKTHFNAISDQDANKLRAFYKKGVQEPESQAKKTQKVIIRRRSVAPSKEESSKEVSKDEDVKRQVQKKSKTLDNEKKASPSSESQDKENVTEVKGKKEVSEHDDKENDDNSSLDLIKNQSKAQREPLEEKPPEIRSAVIVRKASEKEKKDLLNNSHKNASGGKAPYRQNDNRRIPQRGLKTSQDAASEMTFAPEDFKNTNKESRHSPQRSTKGTSFNTSSDKSDQLSQDKKRTLNSDKEQFKVKTKNLAGYYYYDKDEEEFKLDSGNVRTVIPQRKSFHRKRDKKALSSKPSTLPAKSSKRIVRFSGPMSVSDVASALSQKSNVILKSLLKLGVSDAHINQILDLETVTLLANEFEFEVQNVSVSLDDIIKKNMTVKKEDKPEARPPIITIMGHVDHGKTSLLDALRTTNIAGKEAGGITQHIGAYQVDYKKKKLTFLDTPGHEAFTAMRARGAQVTDIVVLVVAADDGVMPQTLEAISHAKAAEVPIIVAVNKIDKQGADPEKIYRELSEHGVIPEEWGGDSIFVKVSAKNRQGLNELLDVILLQAEVHDYKASVNQQAFGYVIEAKLDKHRGALATLIVMQGTLSQQNIVVVGKTFGRVRAMFNENGKKLKDALPGTPVEVIGLNKVPKAGEKFYVVANDAIAKEATEYLIEHEKQEQNLNSKPVDLMDLLKEKSGDVKELCLILKADTQGSVEAIKSSIEKLNTDKIKNKVILSAVGGITETDVTLGEASNAILIGFNVRPEKQALDSAEKKAVTIQCFTIIYELLEFVESAMVGKLDPIKSDKVIGQAEVSELFHIPKVGVIAGAKVSQGKVTRHSILRVVRDGAIIYTGKLSSLKRFKEDVKEVSLGFECGIGVENYNDIKIGDVIEAFVIEEQKPSLR